MKKLMLVMTVICSSVMLAAADKTLLGLDSQAFLEEIRQPLKKDLWTEITGKITHKNKKTGSVKGELRLRITFSPDSLHAQIVLNKRNVYGFEQKHGASVRDGKPVTKLDLPAKELKPGLFDFGLAPADLTFSFLYWKLLEELPESSSRMQVCRVMKLADPEGTGYVQVLFHKMYGFPMEAAWYRNGQPKPWRELVMKGAKRFKSGMWFVKEMRLDGPGWKTRVLFDFAELNKIQQ